MRRLMLATAIAAACAVPAHAISRYNSESMSCARAQSLVQSEGAVILRYASRRNPSLPLYDRYVRHGGYCSVNEAAVPAYVPTSDDGQCFVRVCKPIIYDDDF